MLYKAKTAKSFWVVFFLVLKKKEKKSPALRVHEHLYCFVYCSVAIYSIVQNLLLFFYWQCNLAGRWMRTCVLTHYHAQLYIYSKFHSRKIYNTNLKKKISCLKIKRCIWEVIAFLHYKKFMKMYVLSLTKKETQPKIFNKFS